MQLPQIGLRSDTTNAIDADCGLSPNAARSSFLICQGPPSFAGGDGLMLEDGRVILVVAADEPLLEITAADGEQLARLALAHR